MRVAYRLTLEKVLKENPTEYAVIKLMKEVEDAVQKVVEQKISLFNAEGKAKKAC
jgi:fructose/tagatose bisphosphate aldolase